MKDIHDIRPPMNVGVDPGIFITIGVISGALILGILLFILIRKWLKNRSAGKNAPLRLPLIPAYESAIQKIDLLMTQERADLRQFYFELTTILREYIGRSFDFRAAEMTSQEFVTHLQGLCLDIEVKHRVSRFHAQTDPIKYAGITPDKARVDNDLTEIRTLIETIETHLIDKKQSDQSQTTPDTRTAHPRLKGGV